ncbi:MAG: hypothetical protein RIB93_23955 [Coleofasciculus sp. D1-CHI-01]|uniref:hypothetical protein n=1 Tax=Coleofasciculus sp. D1-CHI-01 TaxID=3068482 RepID=UPI0032F83EEB
MQNKQADDFYLSQNLSSRQTINTEQPSHYPFSTNSPKGNSSSFEENGGLLLMPLSFMVMAWVVLILLRSNVLKSFRNRLKPIKGLHQVPCLNCKYFKNDPYLKCAVNPCTVLTEEAANCSDYSSKDSQ